MSFIPTMRVKLHYHDTEPSIPSISPMPYVIICHLLLHTAYTMQQNITLNAIIHILQWISFIANTLILQYIVELY